MGKDHDLIQAVKDNDGVSIQKILQKLSKTPKAKIIGNNKKININFQDGDGMSALHQAALMGSTDVIKLLLDAGAAADVRDNKGMVALHYAAWQGRPEPVHALLQKLSPVNEQALNGETPLHLASQHGHIHVVKLLLAYHGDPTICNKDLKTPLDLACEFGRDRVVEQLLQSNLCEKLLQDSPTDTLDNSRTTCLHLAARNGHSDIIRLLIQNGMNINRYTLNGTCLHEAALYGKTEVVRLLLDCGIDVNKPNSYDQTALDIVNKFTTSRAAKELKQLLKEASFAVQARAVKDYFNLYDPQSLAFKEGDIITVLEQRSDGHWKGYVANEGRMARAGFFPSTHVVLVDSQALKQQIKPPQVPDLLNRGPYYNHNGHANVNGYPQSDTTSCSSSSTDDSFPPPPHITSSLGPPPGSIYTSYGPPPASPGYGPPPASPGYGPSPVSGYNSCGPVPSSAHSHLVGGPPPSPGYICASPGVPGSPHREVHENSLPAHGLPYPSQHSQYLSGKSVSIHGQINLPGGGEQHAEWAGPVVGAGPGGDMRAGSPSKDNTNNHSPAHSNRNSAASSDSGRGFSTGHLEPKVVTVIGQHRLSGQSYESGVSSRQSYHSTSSSSLGSLDRLEESSHSSTINVQQLIQASVPDKEVLQAWLHDLHFEEYFSNFVQAGYDMATISRMTPEDLTAIGITKPAHRKRLKSEIARLHISDGIPDFCPHDLLDWLHLLGLGSYYDTLVGQGYDNIEYVTDITWEDLEEIGIKRLGHQKKIMLAIDRLKRIMSGTKRLSTIEPRLPSIEMLEPPPPAPPIGRWSGEICALPPHMYEGGLGLGAKPKKSPSGDSISTTGSGSSNSSQGSGEIRVIPLPREDAGIAGGIPYTRQNSNSSNSSGHQPDVVAIQVKRQARSSTSDETKDVGGVANAYQSFQAKTGSVDYASSYPMSMSDPGVPISSVSLAPKVHPKPTPQAVAKKLRSSQEFSADGEMEKHESECNSDGNKSPPPMLTSVAAMAAKMERSGECFTGGTLKRNGGIGVELGRQLHVETKEHIYDQPRLGAAASPSVPPVVAPNSPKPQVMPKPASPLHVATHHEPVVPTSGSPTGRSKKAPPPPPKRTHSIRTEAPLVTKVESTSAFTVTTTASVNANHPVNSTSVSNSSSTSGSLGSANTNIKQTPQVQEKNPPQTQAFASCVKSLSERFGKKSETDGSQESLSSDSDEFPPPPPPIAMDIITPKILNYGIPSKSDSHTPPHMKDFSAHTHHGKDYNFHNRLKHPQTLSESPAIRSDQQSLTPAASNQKRISPAKDIQASSVTQDKGKNGDSNLYSSSLVDKRSESTTSFESTASSSSTDSNTLPFANENVGTIKQRVAATKPSIVQSFDSHDGQRSIDLNVGVFNDNLASRTKSSGDGSVMDGVSLKNAAVLNRGGMNLLGENATRPNASSGSFNENAFNMHKSVAELSKSLTTGTSHNVLVQSAVATANNRQASVHSSSRLSQNNQNAPTDVAGQVRPPVPGKKPVQMPMPLETSQFSQQNSQSQDSIHQPGQPLQQPNKEMLGHPAIAQPAASEVRDERRSTETGDVLSDIDNMLQDLTDELDAMLLEESVS